MSNTSVAKKKNRGNDENVANSDGNDAKLPVNRSASSPLTRRNFLGSVGGVAAVAMAAGSIPLEPLFDEKYSVADAAIAGYDPGARAAASLNYRTSRAQAQNV